ncbi:MAG: lytic transglycosylase [Desulfobacterales bacterium]|nr:MAG: lytic transglycosylase [Desulfobacterales bacterium]
MPMSDQCTLFKQKRLSRFSSITADNRKKNRNQNAYDSTINHFGDRYRVDPDLIKAVIRTESGFDCYAVSSKGAQGLMQLMPETAQELHVVNPFDPRQNIEGGTRYLRYLLDTFNENINLTLAAYHAGPTRVKQIQNIPQIPETVTYVKRVLHYYKGYQKIDRFLNGFGGTSIRVHEAVTIR